MKITNSVTTSRAGNVCAVGANPGWICWGVGPPLPFSLGQNKVRPPRLWVVFCRNIVVGWVASGRSTMLVTVCYCCHPHSYPALQTLSAPWPRPRLYAFTALRPRLALIVILLPEHGASRAKAEIVCCCLRLKSHFVVQAPTPCNRHSPLATQRTQPHPASTCCHAHAIANELASKIAEQFCN